MSVEETCAIISAVLATSTTLIKVVKYFINREVRLRVIEEKLKESGDKAS